MQYLKINTGSWQGTFIKFVYFFSRGEKLYMAIFFQLHAKVDIVSPPLCCSCSGSIDFQPSKWTLCRRACSHCRRLPGFRHIHSLLQMYTLQINKPPQSLFSVCSWEFVVNSLYIIGRTESVWFPVALATEQTSKLMSWLRLYVLLWPYIFIPICLIQLTK